MTTDLASALSASIGTTCVVGAGGKKTLLYRLASDLSRAVVTATVRIPIFDGSVAEVIVTDDPLAAIRNATTWPLGLIPARDDNRYLGYEPEVVDRIGSAEDADAVLVKADGARNRLFKAPGPDEPRIPRGTDTVLPIASAKIVGKPLNDEYVHRPERVAAITDLDRGDEITVETVAEVLSHRKGGRKGVPAEATIIPVLNMVDDSDLESIAREIAAGVHQRTSVPRVVLTKLIADDPVIGVVRP